MTWQAVVDSLDFWNEGDTWGGGNLTAFSTAELNFIMNSLFEFYNTSPSAKQYLDGLAGLSNDIRIGKTSTGSFTNLTEKLVGFNPGEQVVTISTEGTVIPRLPEYILIHELLHLYTERRDFIDSSIIAQNAGNYDFLGPVVFLENKVSREMGDEHLQDSGYLMRFSFDFAQTDLGWEPSKNYTAGANIDIGRMGDVDDNLLDMRDRILPTDDLIIGHLGNDEIHGGAGDDHLYGDRVDDFPAGGNDSLHGGEGNDRLYGGSGNDTLSGDDGDDKLWVGEGTDILSGGSGIDEAIFDNDFTLLFEDTPGARAITVGPADMLYSIERITGSAESDRVIVDSLSSSAINALEWIDLGANTASGDSIEALLSEAVTIDLAAGRFSSGALGFSLRNIENASGSDGDDFVTGNASNNVLHGGRGKDEIRGGAGDDTIHSGNDSVQDKMWGGEGKDYFFGYDDDIIYDIDAGDKVKYWDFVIVGGPAVSSYPDNYRYYSGNLLLFWKPGSTTLRISGTDGPNPVGGLIVHDFQNGDGGIFLGSGAFGSAGTDAMSGGAGNDEMSGLGGDDTLAGGGGDDLLDGGDGDDIFLVAWSSGSDRIFGGYGTDTLEYAPEIAPLAVRVSQEGDDLVLTVQGTSDRVVVPRGIAGGENYGIEQVRFADGTIWSQADLIAMASATMAYWGDSAANEINGDERQDTIFAGAGNDILNGAGGDDRLYGEAGSDQLSGGTGNDLVEGGTGDDVMDGGAGDDEFTYGPTGDGYDHVAGGEGFDTIRATAANVWIGLRSLTSVEAISSGGFSGVTLWGSAAADRLSFAGVTLTGIAKIDGYGGNDHITGSAGPDTIMGGSGDDTLVAGLGDDALAGGAGNDNLAGGGGDDIFRYGTAGDGYDHVDGGDGFDTIVATGSNVWIGLTSLTGVEAISSGGYAGVTVWGSTGSDTLSFAGVTFTGIVKIDGYSGNDHITGSAGPDTIMGGTGGDTLIGGAGDDDLTGGAHDDSLVGGAGDDIFRYGYSSAGDGYDHVSGGDGFDTIVATGSNAWIGLRSLAGVEAISSGGFSGVAVWGSIGSDTLSFAGVTITGIVKIDGYDGNDSLTGSSGADNIVGGNGNDVIDGGAGNDTIDGGAGVDTASYSGSAAGWTILLAAASNQAQSGTEIDRLISIENVVGGGGADTIVGNSAANILRGGAGSDVLRGGAGTDRLEGGAGSDTFRFEAGDTGLSTGADRITDMESGADLIDLSALDASTVLAGDQAFTFIGTAAFSGVAGQLRYHWNGTDTVLQADTDGDSSPNLEIILTGAVALLASDFVL